MEISTREQCKAELKRIIDFRLSPIKAIPIDFRLSLSSTVPSLSKAMS